MTLEPIDVVVVTYESAGSLPSCLASLPVDVNIIVVDNNSSDGSADLAEDLGCTVLRNDRNAGFGRAVNRALRECVRADVVLLLNPDATIDGDSLDLLRHELDEPDVAVAGPKLLRPDGSVQRPWWPFPTAGGAWREAFGLHRAQPERFEATRDVDFVVGACFLARTAALRAVGGFDERYWLYGDEADLCRRLHDDGWRIRYVADATATHVGGASGASQGALVAEHFARGSERFVLTHEGAWSLVSFRLANITGSLFRLPLLRAGDPRRAERRRTIQRNIDLLRHRPTRVAHIDRVVAQPGLVVCSLEPWDTVWRRNQFMVRELTDADPSLRVLFVEPPADPIYHLLRHRRLLRLRRARRLRPVPDRPQVVRFQPVKPLPRLLGAWSDKSLARQIIRAADQAELVDPTLWVNDLDLTSLALSVQWPVLYDVTDDWLWASVPRRVVRARRRREQQLLARADEVVVCSPGLENTKGLFRAVRVVTNAVDLEQFTRPRKRPADLPPPPVALYIGTLHEDRLDVDLVMEAATELPHVQFALLGPDALSSDSRDRLGEQRNVSLLGPRPFTDVPAYAQHATVALVPHVVTPFTESLDPIKAYECLAVGRPTLATPVAGFRDVGPPVHVATAEEFVTALAALIDDCPPATPRTDIPTWHASAAAFADALRDARKARE